MHNPAGRVERWRAQSKAIEAERPEVQAAGVQLDAGVAPAKVRAEHGRRATAVALIARAGEGWTDVDVYDATTFPGHRAVSALMYDPDGSREAARKAKTGGRCGTCGGPTSYRTGGAARTCHFCLAGKRNPARTVKRKTCGVPGCSREKDEGRHICADHSPFYERLRDQFAREEGGRSDFTNHKMPTDYFAGLSLKGE